MEVTLGMEEIVEERRVEHELLWFATIFKDIPQNCRHVRMKNEAM